MKPQQVESSGQDGYPHEGDQPRNVKFRRKLRYCFSLISAICRHRGAIIFIPYSKVTYNFLPRNVYLRVVNGGDFPGVCEVRKQNLSVVSSYVLKLLQCFTEQK
jgi:hypothetical protein